MSTKTTLETTLISIKIILLLSFVTFWLKIENNVGENKKIKKTPQQNDHK